MAHVNCAEFGYGVLLAYFEELYRFWGLFYAVVWIWDFWVIFTHTDSFSVSFKRKIEVPLLHLFF